MVEVAARIGRGAGFMRRRGEAGRKTGAGSGRASLRLRISLLAALLILMAWAGSLRDLLDWKKGYVSALEAREANIFVDRLLQAGQNFAFERGRANVLLAAEGAADAANLGFLAERRRAADGNLDEALAFPRLAQAGRSAALRQRYEELRRLRPEVDRALALPKTERPAGLSERWFAAATALVDELGALTAQAALNRGAYTSSFRIYSRIKVLVFNLRDTLGLESTHIAALVSGGGRLDVAGRDEIMGLRGRSSATWESIRQESELLANGPVEAAAAEVERRLFGDLRPLQDRILEEDRLGRPFTVSSDRLILASVPALDAVAALMRVLTEESRIEIEGEAARLRASYLFRLGLTLATLLVGLLVAALVNSRLLAPLARLQRELAELTRGNTEIEISGSGRADELGRMEAAVVAFRDSLLERGRLEERLLAQSRTDALTGVANRREMDRVLLAEWQRALRHGQELSLVMVDVDLFKSFNDRYGHQSGDECLRSIAQVLAYHARREGDFVARYGGEEFLAVLPGLSLEEARSWAETVRGDVRNLGLAHEDSPKGVVTISCGVARALAEPGLSPESLLRKADKALYLAKAGGRDRVESSGAPSSSKDTPPAP